MNGLSFLLRLQGADISLASRGALKELVLCKHRGKPVRWAPAYVSRHGSPWLKKGTDLTPLLQRERGMEELLLSCPLIMPPKGEDSALLHTES